MGWNKVTKEELKEAGLDVDAFTAAMGNINKVGELETKLTELKTTVDGVVALKDTLTSLENKLKELKPAASGGGQGSGASSGASGEGAASSQEENLDWVLEPEKATQATIMKTVAPMVNNVAEMRVSLNISNFKSKQPKGFAKYETEIMELFNKQPLPSKMNPDLIENCYKIVLANHVDEISKGGESFFLETSGGVTNPGGGAGGVKKKAVDVLTKDQLEMCAKWSVDPEDYLKELQAGGATTYA